MIAMTKTVWKSEADKWTVCNPSENIGDNPWSNSTKGLLHVCPMQWARYMNGLTCSLVWKDYDPRRDYSLDYFVAATGKANNFLVQRLITMSGIRMAAILNEIYDPHTSLSDRQCYMTERMRSYGEDNEPQVPSDQIRFIRQRRRV